MIRPRTRFANAIDASLEDVTQAIFNKKPKKTANIKLIKSPLRYPGGKSRAIKQIMEVIPRDIDILCSPFFGGGSVELACVQRGINVYGYDAFDPLVNFWKTLIKNNIKLAKIVRKYYPLTRTKFYSLQQKYFESKDKLEMAAIFFVLNRASFSGTTLSGGMSPGHPRFTPSAIKRLEQFKINNLIVEKADFKNSLSRHKNRKNIITSCS